MEAQRGQRGPRGNQRSGDAQPNTLHAAHDLDTEPEIYRLSGITFSSTDGYLDLSAGWNFELTVNGNGNDDDAQSTNGGIAVIDAANDTWYSFDPDSGAQPGMIADVYVGTRTAGTTTSSTLNGPNHFLEEHQQLAHGNRVTRPRAVRPAHSRVCRKERTVMKSISTWEFPHLTSGTRPDVRQATPGERDSEVDHAPPTP